MSLLDKQLVLNVEENHEIYTKFNYFHKIIKRLSEGGR